MALPSGALNLPGPVLDGNFSVLAFSNPSLDRGSFGLLEFDIALLDASKTILSASIRLDVHELVGPMLPEARAAAYNGREGAITDADFFEAQRADRTEPHVVSLGLTTIELNVGQVQAIVDTDTDFLGVALFANQDQHGYWFSTLEHPFRDPAELTIEFVPEPTAFVLLGVGLAALLLVVRRRR